MTYFNRGGGFSRDRGSDRPSYGNRGYDKPQMFTATCDQCGKECQVPFRPNGSKPVFCSECFEAKGGNGNTERPTRRFDRPAEFSGRSSFAPRNEERAPQQNYRDEFLALNRKLDRVLELLAENGKGKVAPKEIVEEAFREILEETPKKAKKAKKTIEE